MVPGSSEHLVCLLIPGLAQVPGRMPEGFLPCPRLASAALTDCVLPDSCPIPSASLLGSLGSQPFAWSFLHWSSLKLLTVGCMCLQKLDLKTPGSLRGRYLKADWVGPSWCLCERENPPSSGGAGIVGTREGLTLTRCVTGLLGSSAVLAPSNQRSVPSQISLPGVDTTDWNLSIHVSSVLSALGPIPCPRTLLGMVVKPR